MVWLAVIAGVLIPFGVGVARVTQFLPDGLSVPWRTHGCRESRTPTASLDPDEMIAGYVEALSL